MESTGSNSPAADTSLQSPAIRDDGKKLAQRGPSSSRAPSSASTKVMIPEFKCKYCPCRFATAKGRGGHERVHRHLPVFRHRKERRRLAPAGPQLRVSASPTGMRYFPGSAHSGVVPLFTGAGGLAPAQPSSAAPGVHVGISRQVNQEKTAQYYAWLRSFAVSDFVSQTQPGGGTGGLPQPSLAALAPVAEGNGGTGGGIRLGGLQAMPQVNQEEETTDGIDLTLRL